MDAWTSSCGFRTGSDRSMSVLMTVKIAEFAPMPTASVSTTTAVKPGFFSNWRKANLKSFITQCLHGIDLGRAPRRQPTRQHRYDCEQHRHAGERHGINRADAVEEAQDKSCRAQRTDQTDSGPNHGQLQALADHERKHAHPLCAQGNPQPNLARSLRHCEGED